MPTTAPYGTWPSALDPQTLVAGARGFSELRADGDRLCWLESRPSEGGRQLVVQRSPDGRVTELTPPGTNARSRVHEYGGGSYLVADGVVWFTELLDQRIHRLDPDRDAERSPDPERAADRSPDRDTERSPRPITPAPHEPAALRYADLVVTPDRRWLIAVRERHEGHGAADVHNELVVLPADASRDGAAGDGACGDDGARVIAHGHDFYAMPRLSPDGTQLAFVAWDHPNMPWNDTHLLLGDVREGGDGLLHLSEPVTVAGGPGTHESVIEPAWSPEGALHAITDRTGWWNLYRWDGDQLVNLAEVELDLGAPAWQFGSSRYGFLADGRIAVIATDRGVERPSLLDPVAGTVEPLDVPHTACRSLTAAGERIHYLGGSPTRPDALVQVELGARDDDLDGHGGCSWTELQVSRELPVDPAWLAQPELISFPTSDGMIAHALYHPPTNPDVSGPDDERPPLIVTSHGGPTAHVAPRLALGIGYWTSRGFAVVDVNYRGSSGFGRAYREALDGTWGVYDVDDCVAAARFLAERGEVDADRFLIRGGSASGFTTLAALTFRDVFAAGASSYGVADLTALAQETHKFESRYLDRLIGPYPEAAAIYRERSPIDHPDGLSCPVILLQGLLDRVVPPSQAEVMVGAMAERGIPHAYVAFPDEDHGFRRAENQIRALEAELSFYAQVLGFDPADDLEPVEVIGLLR